MSFRISLVDTGARRVVPSTAAEVDSVSAALGVLCETLAQEKGVRFEVNGFGQAWPVDVATDLPVLLEQLPEVIQRLEASEATSLDFYEQGLERKVDLIPENERVHLQCTSRARWVPNPSEVVLSSSEVLEMLHGVKDTFMRAAESTADGRLLPWLARWQQ